MTEDNDFWILLIAYR